MKRLNKGIYILLCIFFLGIMACPAYSEFINVGVLLPLSGKLEPSGRIEQQAFSMAADEINAAGAIYGKKIKLIIKDTGSEVKKGRTAIENLINHDKAIVISGGCSSSAVWAASEEAQQKGIPFLVTTASDDKITETGREYIFRLNQPSSEHLDALSSFISNTAKTSPVKTAGIIFENSVGTYGAKKFIKFCKRMGIKIVFKEDYSSGEIDLERISRRIEIKNPDLIYLVPDKMDISLFMQNIKALVRKPKLLVLHSGNLNLQEIEQNGSDFIEYMCSISLWSPSLPYPEAREFHNKFLSRYGSQPDYHAAQAYSSMYVILDALKRAESLTPSGLRDALSLTDMMTAFGPVRFISYGKKSQQNRIPSFMVQWINGRFEPVWPKELAIFRYVYPMPGWIEKE